MVDFKRGGVEMMHNIFENVKINDNKLVDVKNIINSDKKLFWSIIGPNTVVNCYKQFKNNSCYLRKSQMNRPETIAFIKELSTGLIKFAEDHELIYTLGDRFCRFDRWEPYDKQWNAELGRFEIEIKTKEKKYNEEKEEWQTITSYKYEPVPVLTREEAELRYKEKYPEESAEIMKEYSKKYSNAPISITMDNYHEDELLLEKIRKLSGPEGEIAMLESKKLKLQQKIDKINRAIEEVREKKN